MWWWRISPVGGPENRIDGIDGADALSGDGYLSYICMCWILRASLASKARVVIALLPWRLLRVRIHGCIPKFLTNIKVLGGGGLSSFNQRRRNVDEYNGVPLASRGYVSVMKSRTKGARFDELVYSLCVWLLGT